MSYSSKSRPNPARCDHRHRSAARRRLWLWHFHLHFITPFRFGVQSLLAAWRKGWGWGSLNFNIFFFYRKNVEPVFLSRISSLNEQKNQIGPKPKQNCTKKQNKILFFSKKKSSYHFFLSPALAFCRRESKSVAPFDP
jgi:hypothetical protein